MGGGGEVGCLEVDLVLMRLDGVVFCSPQVYYPVKRAARETYTASYALAMSDVECAEVTVLIIDPEMFPKFQGKCGEVWVPVGREASVTSTRNKYGAHT